MGNLPCKTGLHPQSDARDGPARPERPDRAGREYPLHPDPRPGEMEMLATAGFRWVRMDSPGTPSNTKRDEYDLRIVPFAGRSRQAPSAGDFILDYSNGHYDGGQSPASDEGHRAMARWAAAAVKHFRGRGVFWEMYNEPNIHFWRPRPDVHQYAKLALEVGRAGSRPRPMKSTSALRPRPSTSSFWRPVFRLGC